MWSFGTSQPRRETAAGQHTIRRHAPSAGRRPGCVLVSGYSDSGKTTLMERLIPRLRARGLRVGTVKHAHDGFQMDHPGKDSWRHARAGAAAVAVIAPTRTAWLVQTPRELSCDVAVRQMGGVVDLVLVEGFKDMAGPRVLLAPGSGVPACATLGAAGRRLAIAASRCRIGVRPQQLTTAELERVVRFCERHARHRSVPIRPGRMAP